MNTHRSLVLAAALGLTACAETSLQSPARDASVVEPKLVVHVIEAAGGG